MDTLFIINPVSGRGKGKKAGILIENFLNNNSIKSAIIYTKSKKHATELASEYQHKTSRIIVVGGDGTLNEVINGVTSDNILIGFIPTGTGNDFGINVNSSKIIINNLKSICYENYLIKKIDVGYAEIKETNNEVLFSFRFINSLGIGFDAQIAYLAQHNKFLTGIYAYIFALIKALFNYGSLKLKIIVDGIELYNAKAVLAAIGNGKTSGGGFYLTPEALINDGKLDLCIVDMLKRRSLLMKLPLAIINKIQHVKEVKLYKFSNLIVNSGNPAYIHADGEVISKSAENISVKVLKNYLNFIIYK